jgi:hypothetical protein
MGASTLLTRPAPAPIDFANLNLNVPSVPPPITALTPGRDREAQLLRRVRELEEEVRSVRLENEKQVRLRDKRIMAVHLRHRVEGYDCQVPGAVGEAQGVSEAQEGCKSCWSFRVGCSRAYRGGAGSRARFGRRKLIKRFVCPTHFAAVCTV